MQNDGNSTADAGDILRFIFSEEVANTNDLSDIFESGSDYGSTVTLLGRMVKQWR